MRIPIISAHLGLGWPKWRLGFLGGRHALVRQGRFSGVQTQEGAEAPSVLCDQGSVPIRFRRETRASAELCISIPGIIRPISSKPSPEEGKKTDLSGLP
jgi:hypothetical protein